MTNTVKMIAYDVQNPHFMVRLEAPTPGHFNYIESTFVQCFPSYKEKRFTLVVQEVKKFPKNRVIDSKPISTSTLTCVGELSGDEFVNLVAGIKPPDMTRKRR